MTQYMIRKRPHRPPPEEIHGVWSLKFCGKKASGEGVILETE